jgi:predicted LPLAT superfamily acyltransferase
MSTLFQGHRYLATITGRGHHKRVLRVATQLNPIACIASFNLATFGPAIVADLQTACNAETIDKILGDII